MTPARTGRVADPWGERTPYAAGEPWPVRVDLHLADGVEEATVDRWVPAASILHSNGDGQEIAVKDGRIVGVRGAARDRVNHGRLGPKDLYGWQANAAPDRLTRPLVRDWAPGGGDAGGSDTSGPADEARGFRACGWDEAMETIVARTRTLMAEPGGAQKIAFYTSGQLFLEEYYTLAVIGKAGLGTPHMDGNTRLCTATAAASLRASFGTDGQPASYSDVDHCDALALWGHNVAATQAVLWMRMLDRLHGPDPPRLLCVDPRVTPVARAAELHLAPRPGTNLALMNGLLREVIARSWIDEAWIDRHTLGFERLVATVAPCTPARTAEICDVAARDVEAAAELAGTSERLLSTVLQGFYQSHQATAAACAVNDLHLLRGMIGRPGAGVCQMNGQPTAQNTRETGADGDMPGMRNWENEDHIRELAEIWNVEAARIPHDRPPTHAMEIWRRAEAGEVELLWISATNPAVSLPDLGRIREILRRPGLFVVVQDLFLTETALLADVVLPAATWGERRTAPSRTPTARSTTAARRSTRPARRAPTWRSSSTTPAGSTCATATAGRS